MKTTSFKIIFLLVALTAFSIYQMQGQTKLSGNGANTCAANDGGVPGNTSLGCNAGKSTMSGAYNTSLGESAGNALTSGYSNTFSGYQSGLANTTGYSNTFSGTYSGLVNTTGNYNAFVGHGAGYDNIIGVQNTYVGGLAGRHSTANYNTLIGSSAGYTNSTGEYNTFTGWKAGYYNTTGYYNTFNGNNAGYANTTASYNTALGYLAGQYTTTGSNNTFLGYNTGGQNNTTGTNSTFVGYGANSTSNYSNATAIGYNATVSANNSLVLGNGANVGIGTSTPGAILHLNGSSGTTLKIVDGNQGSGKILTSDANGVASWASPVTSGTAWQLTGNAGLVDGTNFLGTTTASGDKPLNFRVNNEKAGRIDNSGPTFIGYQSGNSNTAASNTGFGYKALFSNTSGNYNTAFGRESLLYNTTGNQNVAIGLTALYNNTTGSNNTATGLSALNNNTTGYNNTANGLGALNSNITGVNNVAIGALALFDNTTGSDNVAVGLDALMNIDGSDPEGCYNTAIGMYALANSIIGYHNTALGWDAGDGTDGYNNTFVGSSSYASGDYYNATAIGAGTLVSTNNKVRIGNSTTSVVEGQVAYTYPSDGRFKFNIIENVKGLEFINKLRPVNYQFNTQEFDVFLTQNMPDSLIALHISGLDYAPSTNIIHTGFIAQEVEQAAVECGYIFDGIHTPVNENDNYSLAYSQFVVPLVKAVQELDKTIDSLKTSDSLADIRANIQTGIINSLLSHQQTTDSLLAVLQNCCTLGTTNKIFQNNSSQEVNIFENKLKIELANNNQTILYQNEPNPFNKSTVIRYFVPEDIIGIVYIVFYDMYGKELNKIDIITKGVGSIEVNTENLTSGIYSYSLIINNKVIETKKMVKNN